MVTIRDQIHGNMQFSEAEMAMIRSKPFERLRYIKQLAFAEFEYPGATHNRYQHSLGVCQCVSDMYEAVNRNSPEFFRDGDIELLRMMGLIHDLGHSPFSHASEELSNITHEQRLTDILELYKKAIIIPNNSGVENWDLVNQVYQGDGYAYLTNPHYITLHSFLDSFLDADKLDYLERDALNCGVSYGNFDRQDLIANLCIVHDDRSNEVLGLREEGIQAFEGFLLARYYMFNKVYFDPIERINRIQFVDAMKGLLPDGKYPDNIKKFLGYDDTRFIKRLNFLYNPQYKLIYDSAFDSELLNTIADKLGNMVLIDTPKKNIFRRDKSDSNLWIKNTLTGVTRPCTDISPLIRGIQFASVHKLRVYAPTGIADEVREELLKLVRSRSRQK